MFRKIKFKFNKDDRKQIFEFTKNDSIDIDEIEKKAELVDYVQKTFEVMGLINYPHLLLDPMKIYNTPLF